MTDDRTGRDMAVECLTRLEKLLGESPLEDRGAESAILLGVAQCYATLDVADATRADTATRLHFMERDLEIREEAAKAMENSAGRLAPLVELVSAVDEFLGTGGPDTQEYFDSVHRLVAARATLGDLPVETTDRQVDGLPTFCAYCGNPITRRSDTGEWTHLPEGDWPGGGHCRHIEGVATP